MIAKMTAQRTNTPTETRKIHLVGRKLTRMTTSRIARATQKTSVVLEMRVVAAERAPPPPPASV